VRHSAPQCATVCAPMPDIQTIYSQFPRLLSLCLIKEEPMMDNTDEKSPTIPDPVARVESTGAERENADAKLSA
jgi:hypothetical protein